MGQSWLNYMSSGCFRVAGASNAIHSVAMHGNASQSKGVARTLNSHATQSLVRLNAIPKGLHTMANNNLVEDMREAIRRAQEAGVTTRSVIHGERLTGHGRDGIYPSILINDLDRPEGVPGALMCAIESFHWAQVEVKGNDTTLIFEGKTRLTVSGGVVEYVTGGTMSSLATQ
jgi:hypothetical protein